MEKEEITLTHRELEEFSKNRVWRYIVAYMVDRTSAVMEDNNKIDPFKEPSAICRNQGIIAGMGDIIDLPSILLAQIDYNKKQEEMKKDANRE